MSGISDCEQEGVAQRNAVEWVAEFTSCTADCLQVATLVKFVGPVTRVVLAKISGALLQQSSGVGPWLCSIVTCLIGNLRVRKERWRCV